MERYLKFLLFIYLLCVVPSVMAKEWRGITPFRSTRADVTRLLGPSPDTNEFRANYDIEGQQVYIVFSDKLESFPACASSLPIDAVILIKITPHTQLPLASYGIDEKRFRVMDPSKPPGMGYKGYIDENEGLVIRTFRDKVQEINYFASSNDKHLCPGYSENPERIINVLVDGYVPQLTVDIYNAIRFSKERSRLDDFAIFLKNSPDERGYVIVYPDGKVDRLAAKKRGERAVTYLRTKWHFKKGKIVVVVGTKQNLYAVHLVIRRTRPYIMDKAPAQLPTKNH